MGLTQLSCNQISNLLRASVGCYGQNIHDTLVRYLGSGVQMNQPPSSIGGMERGYDDNRSLGNPEPAGRVDLQDPRLFDRKSGHQLQTTSNRTKEMEGQRALYERLSTEG